MITPRRQFFNRIATTAFAALLVTSACSSPNDDRTTDANAQDTVSPAGSTELTGKQFDVYRDPG